VLHPAAPQLGPYRVLHQIGAGGMGAVYRGVHVETGDEVALKTVRVQQANELAAIRTEIQALRRVTHPSIVRILDAGVHGGSPWYAMELLQGTTLQDFQGAFWHEWRIDPPESPGSPEYDAATMTQRTGGSGPVIQAARIVAGAPVAAGKLGEALTLVRRLCGPLAYLHQLGIVHRDLKPGNVFVRPDGWPVLMDFGLVSRFGASGRDVLEIAGTLAGTAAYMAPEQILRQRVDARTDLYALGCMLFELLTGRPPFVGSSLESILQQQLNEPALPASRFVTGVAPTLDELLLSLLAKRVRDRIGHADDVAAWLVSEGAEAEDAGAVVVDARPAYLYRPDLAGRDAVLEELDAHVRRLHRGLGGCVLLGGESGVGKTSLVAEVARAATLQHLEVAAGECQPIGGGALHPLVPLLGRIVDRAVEGGRETAERLFGSRARVLAAVEPGVARVPGFEDAPLVEDLPADAARSRLLADLRETIATFTEEGPVLLILDDLQWADPLTLQFLLTTRGGFFERNALLVIGTFRSDEQPDLLQEVLSLPNMTRLDLGRLDQEAVGAMVGDMLAMAAPPAAFVEFLATHSEGNPFFVAEYLRGAVAERLLRRRHGRWVFGDAADDEAALTRMSVPASLRELVERRFADLPEHARALAQLASIFGREVDAALLLAAASMDESDAMEAIRELKGRQVLDRIDGGGYRFLHDKLRETAYSSVPEQVLPSVHRRAADALETVYGSRDDFPRYHGRLAYHYERAGDRPRAIEYLEKAADTAAQAYADRDVATYLTTALRLDAEQEHRVDLNRRTAWRTAVGMALRGLGEIEQSRATLEEALAEMGQPVATRSALAAARQVLQELVFRRSLASPPIEPRASNPTAERALNAYNYVAMIAYHQTDVPAQVFCTFAGLRLAPLVGPSAPAAQLYAAAGNILGFAGLQTLAWRYANLAKQIAQAAQHSLSTGLVHQYSGHLGAVLGDMAKFERDMMVALETYTQIGHHRFREEALTNIGHLQLLRGQYRDSYETFRDIEESAQARDDPQTRAWGALGQARLAGLLGRTEEALARLDAALGLARDDLSQLDGRATRALFLAQAGDRDCVLTAVRHALDAIERMPTTSYTNLTAYSSTLEALFLVDGAAVHEEVARMSRRLLAAFRRFARIIRLGRPRLQLWTAVADWHQGRHRRAQRGWIAALQAARRMDLPVDLALTHFWIGRCVPGTGRTEHLHEALRAFEEMEAQWYVRESRRMLAQAPDRSRRDE
jgi:eukaryotic-like serine/threonine-protein kinase